METHIDKLTTKYQGFDFADVPTSGRVLALCGVTCDVSQIVKRDPSCTWCARKLEEAKTGRRDRGPQS